MAKHRVLYTIEQLGFPIVDNDQAGEPQLVFDFKADDQQKVSTGHADGRITINIIEADSAVREQTRVQFGEPQRTLVGHFRHELGHYYWDLLVKPHLLEPFRALFGNEQSPTYQEAQKSYYQNGPLKDWRLRFVSGYASMHPWEDFAETFNAYLDMATIIATTNHFQLTDQRLDDFEGMLEAYQSIGIAANEMNRDMGLLDLVPEVFTEPVQEKLKFVHRLRATATKHSEATAEEAPVAASH
jgi:hypothetical protein